MPRIDFELTEDLTNFKGHFTLTIGYPRQVKIITQSRAVDVNALVGNIGGYIGLFLGILYCYNYFTHTKTYIL